MEDRVHKVLSMPLNKNKNDWQPVAENQILEWYWLCKFGEHT